MLQEKQETTYTSTIENGVEVSRTVTELKQLLQLIKLSMLVLKLLKVVRTTKRRGSSTPILSGTQYVQMKT